MKISFKEYKKLREDIKAQHLKELLEFAKDIALKNNPYQIGSLEAKDMYNPEYCIIYAIAIGEMKVISEQGVKVVKDMIEFWNEINNVLINYFFKA